MGRFRAASMLALLGAFGCSGNISDGGYDDAALGGDTAAEVGGSARDVSAREVNSSGGCEDPDRPGQRTTRACNTACGAGTQTCLGADWSACTAREPVAERCGNGVDDDCDGRIDEDCGACEPGATRGCSSGSSMVGACRPGSETCGADRRWGSCVGEVRPVEETCNGVDDDCDGTVDDRLLRACAGACGAGMQACIGGAWSACSGRAPSEEVCNGVDDDCDGSVDESLMRTCAGACGVGLQICAGGLWSVCMGRSPSTEVCNGVDDDCDGSVDESLTRSCSSSCGVGTQACASGSWSSCSARSPSAEVCNGVDDDCDGSIDESLTRSCSSACGAGTETCDHGFWTGCTAPRPAREVCNLRDDNCDGRIDEGLTATYTFHNFCVRSRAFVTFGGCNACRSVCTGYWIDPGRDLPVQLQQNTCYTVSMMVRTPSGDMCIDRDWPSGRYVGEVSQLCNGDCQPFGSGIHCNGD